MDSFPEMIKVDEAASYRRQDQLSKSHPSHSLKAELVRRAATRSNPKVTVDLGCGTGRYFHAVQRGAQDLVEIIGVDVSKNMLREAEHAEGFNSRVRLVCADLTDWEPPGSRIDLVCCIGVIGQHIPLDVHWLRRVRSWLNANGRFAFTAIAWQPRESWRLSWKQHLALACRPFLPKPVRSAIDRRFDKTHLTLTETQLKARLCSAGFQLEEFSEWQSDNQQRIDFLVCARASSAGASLPL